MAFQRFGPNETQVEDDVVYSIIHGVISLDEARRFLDLVAEVRVKHGHVLMLSNVTEGFGMSPETRRYTAEWSRTHKMDASALFGASALARSMIMLVTRAMAVIGRAPNIAFFATEKEARTWLDHQRDLLHRKHK